MKTKIFVISVLALFVLIIYFGDVFSAQGRPVKKAVIPSDRNYQPDCEDINPDSGVIVLQHDQWGTTWYDEQQIGSIGRMISADPAGNRNMVFHRSDAEYPPGPRWVCYNCKDPWDIWCCAPECFDHWSECNAGYANVDHMRDGRALVLYHHTAPCETGAPIWYTTLRYIWDPIDICTPYFQARCDLPDYFTGRDEQGMWPKMCVCPVGDTDYMHIVMTEGKSAGGNQYLGYIRCRVTGETQLVCETPDNGQQGVVTPVTVNCGNDEHGCGSFCPTAYFGEAEASFCPDCVAGDYPNTISVIAVSSPASPKVAIVFTNKKVSGPYNTINNDVFYTESDSNGYEWFPQYDGTWPPTVANGMLLNVTQYPADYPERAYTDVAACYDYEDNLHIVWNSCSYDPSTGNPPSFYARLMHWVNTDAPGINNATVVASGYPEGFEFLGKMEVYPWWLWPDIKPGDWNRSVCKPSISAMDTIYHPDEPSYLFCTWTQFDPGDSSVEGYGNGDIYGSVSGDGGASWWPIYNLTNTKTPDCDPDAEYPCLSEHWSSMVVADSTLHISYVCDRDAGAAVQYEGEWTENDMMYLHLKELPYPETCAVSIKLTYPPDSWCNPPLKVLPGETREIVMRLKGLGTLTGGYSVTTDNPYVVCCTNCSGTLNPQEKVTVSLLINCPDGDDSFIAAKVFVDYCIGTDDVGRDTINLHVVQSDDYWECPRDTIRTTIWKDNCTLIAWFCANCEQRVWDKRVLDPDDEEIQPIFSAGPIVATTWMGDTVVGRQDYDKVLTGARDTLHHVVGQDPDQPECAIQVIWTKNVFICAWPLPIPTHQRWWWIDVHKQIFMWDDWPFGGGCPEIKKEQIIKQIRITRSLRPNWWPSSEAMAYEDIWFGYFADVDAPFDDGGNGYNTAGYEPTHQMVWFHGWMNDTLPPEEQHPEYEEYYVGLKFTDRDGNVVTPLGVQVVRNDSFLYPNDNWGWKDQELYDLAATPGVNIHDEETDTLDRSVVMTAAHIPGGTDDFSAEFILIEAFIPTGLADLIDHMVYAQEVKIPYLNQLGVFDQCPICGDVNEDGTINSADIVYLINYLFKGGPPPSWPLNRADCNGDGTVNSADVVCMINYLFKGGPNPNCEGFGG